MGVEAGLDLPDSILAGELEQCLLLVERSAPAKTIQAGEPEYQLLPLSGRWKIRIPLSLTDLLFPGKKKKKKKLEHLHLLPWKWSKRVKWFSPWLYLVSACISIGMLIDQRSFAWELSNFWSDRQEAKRFGDFQLFLQSHLLPCPFSVPWIYRALELGALFWWIRSALTAPIFSLWCYFDKQNLSLCQTLTYWIVNIWCTEHTGLVTATSGD